MALTFTPTRSHRAAELIYHWIVVIAGSALLLWYTWQTPRAVDPWHALIIALLVVLQSNFPLKLLHSEINLIQVIALGGGLLYGPATAAWAVTVGLLYGRPLRRLYAAIRKERLATDTFSWLESLSNAGRNNLALLLALHSDRYFVGLVHHTAPLEDAWPVLLGPILLFAAIHTSLYLIAFLLHGPLTSPTLRRDLVMLGLVELLPLPFVVIAVTAYPIIGIFSLLTIGSIPLVIAILIQNISFTRLDLVRRLQELSTLNQVSQVLRSTLDLEKLLTTIHLEVSHLLETDNFYVALYRPENEKIWYPLSVKGGERQNWAERPLSGRLTDRVILEGKPISIARLQNVEEYIDLPPSLVTPTAWIGVPLISSERTIGCLALFSQVPNARYSEADLDLLITLSGQISVAIENALLYEQAQRRALQLETLNGIGKLITSSLDEQEVLQQVGSSSIQISGAERSAIFLVSSTEQKLELAYSSGFSDAFKEQNLSFSLLDNSRTRCLRTGEPVTISDLRQATLERGFFASLKQEQIAALADFPLLTPEGQVGILSIFFNTLHSFHPEDLELLRTFTGQAAIAIANARRHTRTDLALAQRVQQLSILETVGRELAAAIHSGRLFEMILNYACELTNSPWGCLGIFNAENLTVEIKAIRGYEKRMSYYSVHQGVSGRAVRGHQVVNLKDTHSDPDWVDLTDGEAHSQLSVPLIHEGRVLGILTLENPQFNGYTENDQTFIEQLATQAAVSIANAQLYAEAQRRLREQSTLYLVSTYLAGKLELDGILQIVKRAIESVLQAATVGMYLWDEDRKTYWLQENQLAGTIEGEAQRPQSNNHLLPVISDRALSGLHRFLSDPSPTQFMPGAEMPEALGSGCPACQALVLPLVLNGQRQGMALLHLPAETVMQPDELQLLRAISSQGTLSIQNALLFSDVTHVRDRLAAVLNSVQEGILMIDAGGRVMLVNRSIETMTGLELESLVGQVFVEQPTGVLQLFGYTRENFGDLIGAIGQGHAPSSPKIRLKSSQGKPERILERASMPVWGQAGRIIGWMIVLRDITEEQQIAAAREIITETLIHDLRSPLTATVGALDVIAEENLAGNQPNPTIMKAGRIGHSSTQRVLSLVESLLDISRMQSGSMGLSLSKVDLRQLANNVFTENLPQASEYGVTLYNEIPHDLPEISGDANKLERVLVNLVDNAMKYSPSGGKIVLTVDHGLSNEIVVRVLDDGPGIPEEYREKIFERFGQVPLQRGRTRGSGLGLTFCRLAVEAHGGHIWVEPKQGGGSIFSFTLPLIRDTD